MAADRHAEELPVFVCLSKGYLGGAAKGLKRCMADGEQNHLNTLLQKLGFEPLQKGPSTSWHWSNAPTDAVGRSREKQKNAPTSAWRLDAFALAAKKETLAITQLDLQLDRLQFKRNVEEMAKNHFGAKTTCELLSAEDGDVHMLFEFVRPGSRENSKGYKRSVGRDMPYGIGGYRLRFISEGSGITAVFSNLFGFGYVPTTFVSGLHRHIAQALSLRSKSLKFLRHQSQSIFEFSFHVADVAMSCLASRRQASPAALSDVHAALTKTSERHLKDIRRTCLQTTCIADESVWRVSSLDASHQILGRRSMLGFVPIEVLESRERRDDHVGLDDLFLQGKFEKAAQEVEERLQMQPGSLFLTRRWCALSILGRVVGSVDIAGAGLASEPTNVLFLSSRVNMALTEGNMRGVLENLSRLGEVLLRIIPQAEKARCFDVVLPELLGDAWHDEDPLKAMECYRRIIQKRGDLPRILRKLIGLARGVDSLHDEVTYLERLGAVERRRVELAKIHRRLAEIRSTQPGKVARALEDALLAVEYDRNQIESILLAKELLIGQRRPEEAIQLLDGLLRDQSLEYPGRGRARLEAHIAGIWLRDLNRPDLAEGRYRQALAYDPENIDALRDLESAYRASGDTENLITVLERQFTALERDKDLDSLRDVLRALIELYRNEVDRPADALDLYSRALDSIPIAPQDIDRLLTWPDTAIDWRGYYSKLVSKIQEIANKNERGEYLCRLGELCRSKLQDSKAARVHYLDALHHGVIDSGGFHFLVHHLTSERDYEKLAKCYQLRLAQVSDPQKAALLLDYLNVPEVLSDERRDELALEIYRLQPESEYALKQRFTFYQSMDDVAGVDRLMNELLVGQTSSQYQTTLWLEHAVQVLAVCQDPLRFALMDKFYRELLDLSEDKERIVVEAVRELAVSCDPDLLSRYLGELLNMGLLPDLPDRDVRKLLVGHEKWQALFEMLKSRKEDHPLAAANHARTAAAIYRNLADHKAEEDALARVCCLVAVDAEDMRTLESLTTDSKHFSIYAQALEKQVEFEADPKRKYELLRSLGELYRHSLKRPDLAQQVYKKALSFTGRTEAIKWHIAGLARESNNEREEADALLAFANDPHASVDKIDLAFKRLQSLGVAFDPVRTKIESRTLQAFAAGEMEQGQKFLDLLIRYELVNAEAFKNIFRTAIESRLEDVAVKAWWRGLIGMVSRTDVQSYVDFAGTLWHQIGRPEAMLDCFRLGLRHQIKEHVGEHAYHEYLCQYGLKLFDDDRYRKKATVVMQEAFELDPTESRVWMPLYFLLTDCGEPAQRLRHLKTIVPALEIDPRPLRSFPLTLESLKAEHAELNAQLSGDSLPVQNEFADVTVVTGINSKPPLATEFASNNQDSTNFLRPVTTAPEPSEVWRDEPHSQVLPMVAGEPSYVGFEIDDGLDAGANEAKGFLGNPVAGFSANEPSLVIDIGLSDQPQGSVQDVSLPIADAGLAETQEPSGIPHLSLVNEADEIPNAELHWDSEPGSEEAEEPSMVVDMNDLAMIDSGDSLPQTFEASSDLDLDPPPLPIPVPSSTGPGAPQSLYGDLFDEESDGSAEMSSAQEAAEANLKALPKIEDTTGDGAFQLEMNPTQLDEVGRASSVELAAALGLDDESDDDVDLGNDDQDEDQKDNPDDDQNDDRATALIPSAVDGEGASHSTNSSHSRQMATVDWRPLVESGQVDSKLTHAIINQAFVNEIEKHIALQCVSVLGASVPDLNSWHWRVWRKPEEFGYPLVLKGRYPESAQPEILQSSLAKLVLAAAPLLVRLHRRRFTLEYLARKLKTPVETIERVRQPLSWSDSPAARCGFRLYAERIKKRGYQLFDLPGLQAKIFYEGKNRSIYFDSKHYLAAPPSHLFHRILGVLWSVRLHYFVPLNLHPQKDVLPVLVELAQHFNAQGISAFTAKLRGQSQVIKALSGLDTKLLKELFGRVGEPRLDALHQLWFSMQTQIYSIILAETLDLVGLMESIVDRDFLASKVPLLPGEVLQLSPYSRHLIDFALKMSRNP